jgi:hypothetical protein
LFLVVKSDHDLGSQALGTHRRRIEKQSTRVVPQIALAAAGTSRAVAAPELVLEAAGRRDSAGRGGGGGGGGGGSFSADFGNGLALREARDERDAQGAAALLEMCDVEFVFPGQKASQWVAQVARTAAGVRSYLPPAAASADKEVIHDHGPDDDEAQRARSVFYVLVDVRRRLHALY